MHVLIPIIYKPVFIFDLQKYNSRLNDFPPNFQIQICGFGFEPLDLDLDLDLML